jgi:serine/threonine protein kinase/Tfp pilus assembly protein PilF
MAHELDSWEESAREIMDEWNLGDDDELSQSPLPPYPPGFREGLDAGKGLPVVERTQPEDSFPAGSTALCQAFVMGSDQDGARAEFQVDEADDSDFVAEQNDLCPSRRSPRGYPRGLPNVGDELKGFRLVMELGRGAFARVYLAEEINLGNRLVALKVSRAEGEEPRMLARLQHAHIVPVHSVQDDPATGLRVLCMPYLGGANLSRLLQQAGGPVSARASGRTLVEALDQLSQRLPAGLGHEPLLESVRTRRWRSASRTGGPSVSQPARSSTEGPGAAPSAGPPSVQKIRSLVSRLVSSRSPVWTNRDEQDDGVPSRQFLRGANAIEAAVWVVARLAEGLEHAHSRGLLHRDLKPANILIAADGTPMLLDFNLAAETERRAEDGEEMHRAVLGGTLPYMAPEHLDAFDPQGSTAPESVDERSDLYSLGLILFEMIAGHHPFSEPPAGLLPLQTIRSMVQERTRRPVPSLRHRCKTVPWSLEALVAKCLDPDPARRYARAGDLAEDLRRFLDDLPMKHCAEPSPRERLGKWARRHPAICSSGTIAAASVLLLGILMSASYFLYEGLLELSSRLRRQAFDRDFVQCQFLLNVAGRNDEFLKRGIGHARSLLGEAGIPDPGVGVGEPVDRARDAQPSRAARWVRRLKAEESRRVRRQLVELLMLEARAGVLVVTPRAAEEDRRRALSRAVYRLDQAEGIDAPLPSALFHDRARYLAALGDADRAARDRARAFELSPTSSQDLILLGTSLLTGGDRAGAEAALAEAIAKDPTSLWAWFAMGHCHYEQRRYSEAAGDFNACVALGPEYAWNHFNRGLALALAGRAYEAKASYDRAIKLDPELVEARVDRALVELDLARPEQALYDLRWAVAHGCRQAGVLCALGQTLALTGRTDEAESTFGELLAKHPHDPVVHVARGMTRVDLDPELARQDFRDALDRDPHGAMAHYGMALVLRMRDHRAALEYLDRALELDPNLFDALQVRALERARLGDRGALDDAEALVRSPTMHHLYNAACALAVFARTAGDPRSLDRSIQILELALRAGFPAQTAANDPDLGPLRRRPDYIRLIARFSGHQESRGRAGA